MTRSPSADAKVALRVSFVLFMAALGVTTWRPGAGSVIFDEATSISHVRRIRHPAVPSVQAEIDPLHVRLQVTHGLVGQPRFQRLTVELQGR